MTAGIVIGELALVSGFYVLTAASMEGVGRVLWPEASAERSDDNVVQFVGWLLGCIQTILNMPLYAVPGCFFGRWRNKGSPWLYFNHIYVAVWLVIIGVLAGVVAPRVDGGFQIALVVVVLWRAAEILTWYLKLLFDKGHRVLLEVERNLLFLIADSGAFVTVLAVMLETGNGDDIKGRWSEAFSAFLLNGSPTKPETGWGTAVGIVGPIAGVVLLGAGLGLLMGIIGDRIRATPGARMREKGRGRKEPRYTGPTRPVKPWAKREDEPPTA
jgi:hypothetical protein